MKKRKKKKRNQWGMCLGGSRGDRTNIKPTTLPPRTASIPPTTTMLSSHPAPNHPVRTYAAVAAAALDVVISIPVPTPNNICTGKIGGGRSAC